MIILIIFRLRLIGGFREVPGSIASKPPKPVSRVSAVAVWRVVKIGADAWVLMTRQETDGR